MEWNLKLDKAQRQRERLKEAMATATVEGRRTEFLLTAGQGAGCVTDVLPVAEIIRRIVGEAEEVLRSSNRCFAR